MLNIIRIFIIFVSIALFFLFSSSSYAHTVSEEKAQFHLIFPGQQIAAGQNFPLIVKIDSGTNPVNTVQANLSYPNDKLEFIKIDANGSVFEIQAENIGGGGIVKIARGTIKPVVGEEILAATVYFKTLLPVNVNEIIVAKGSAIVRSTDNIDILSGSETVIDPLTATNTTSQPQVNTPKSNLFSKEVPVQTKDDGSFFERIVNLNTRLWEWVLLILFPSIFTFIKQVFNFR